MQTPKKSRKSFFELSREQQVVLVLLVVLGVGGLALGFQSFGTNIRRPFIAQLSEYAQAGRFLTEDARERQQNQELKKKDSDGDGLNDYDELNVFNTSPYLADTDSDGYNDQEEVFSDNDPNCPQGEDCSQPTEQEDAVPDDNSSTDQLVNPTGSGLISGDGSQADQAQQLDQLLDNMEAAAGVRADGSAVEDDSEASGGANLNLDSQDDIMTFFDTLSADQIRAAMIDAGIPEEQLEGMSDEEIRTLFNEAVGQAQDAGALSDFQNQQDPQNQDSQTQQ